MAKSRASKSSSKKGRSKGGSANKAKVSVPKRSAPVKVKGAYEINCSECYSSFLFNGSNAAQGSRITCPECLHNGQVASGEAMSKIASAKNGEKSKLMPATICAMLFVVVGFAYAVALSSTTAISDGVNYGFLGAEVLLFVIALFFGCGYEKGRREVYF